MIIPLFFLGMSAYAFVLDYFIYAPAIGGAQKINIVSLRDIVETFSSGTVDRNLGELAAAGLTNLVPYVEAILSLPAFNTFLFCAIVFTIVIQLYSIQRNFLNPRVTDKETEKRKSRLSEARDKIKSETSNKKIRPRSFHYQKQ